MTTKNKSILLNDKYMLTATSQYKKLMSISRFVMQDMIDHSTNAREVAQETKRREKLTKQLKECREYDEKLAHLALSRIELDLDDGVNKNYRKIQTANDGKFYEVLADSKNIMSKE